MHTAARRLHDVHETHDRGVVTIHPTQGDVYAASAFDLLGMQFAALAHGLGLFLVGALTLNAPDIGDGLAFGQEVHEILDTTGVQEFDRTRMGRLFAKSAINHFSGG